MIKKYFLVLFIASTSISKAQNELTVTHEFIGRTVLQAFRDLNYEHNIEFDFAKEDIPKAIAKRKVWKIYSNTSLDQITKDLLQFSDLDYKIYGNKVIIRKKGEKIEYLPAKVITKAVSYNVDISGVIRDKMTGERLAYATVYIPETKSGTTTGTDGVFNLHKVPSDTSVIQISFVGFQPLYMRLNPNDDITNLKFDLTPYSNELQEITITAAQKELLRVAQQASQVSMTPKQMKNLPSMGSTDVFRSFQYLPGISASNESSSGLYVRGGTPDQNLILYDGFTVYHVDHLYGMFSAFNANAIKDIELYKGGFESIYGGRVSSVMDITGKEGNRNKASFGAGVSLLSVDGYFETPLGKRSTLMLTGRRSFQSSLYQTLFDQYNGEEEPAQPEGGMRPGRVFESSEPKSYFYDLNGKLTYNFDKDRLTLSFFNGLDVLDNSRTNDFSFGGGSNNGGVQDLTRWGNWGTSLNWDHNWGKNLYSNTMLSYSNYFSERDRTSQRTRVIDDETVTTTNGTLEDNKLNDYTLNVNFDWAVNNDHKVEFGLHNSFYEVQYLFELNDTIQIQNVNQTSSVHSIYAQDKWKVNKKLTVTPGLRTSFYEATEKLYLEPRLMANYYATDHFKIKGSWGLYNQFAKRVIRDDMMSGSRDFWILASDTNINTTSAQHYITGISYEKDKFLLDAELYLKTMNGLTEYGLTYSPNVRKPNYDEFFYNGKGYSMGLELLAQKKYGDFTGWVSYTLGQTKHQYDEYGEDYFLANHDVTQEVNIVAMYEWKKWNFSATWVYGTGKPYTAPIGAYNLSLADGTTESYFLIGDKNTLRLPDYHRLDVSAKFKFRLGTGEAELGASIFNLYNRSNIWYKEFEIIEEEIVETNVNLLGFTPNISLNIKF